MPRPKKIVLKSDGDKKFSAEVFDLVRTKLASMVGGNVNLGVKRAAEHFAPRAPATVTVAEMGDAIPQIATKFEAESSKSADSNTGRLPLNTEAQENWDSGKWRGKLTVHGLRKRFAAEIGDNVELTTSLLDVYTAELAVEKAKIAELVDEKPDPDSNNPVTCGSPAHRGSSEPFQPTIRFRLTRNDAGELVRMRHPKGDDFIQVGNFLVVPAGDEEGATNQAVPYCPDCREAGWEYARNAVDKDGNTKPIKLTFYTRGGAQRVLDATKKSAESQAALGDQIRAAAARVFSGSGTRRQRDWHNSRRPRG